MKWQRWDVRWGTQIGCLKYPPQTYQMKWQRWDVRWTLQIACPISPHKTYQIKWQKWDVRWSTQIGCPIYPPKTLLGLSYVIWKLGLSYVIWINLLWSKSKTRNEFKFSDDVPQIYPHCLKLPVKGDNSLLIYVFNEGPFKTGRWSAQIQTPWQPPDPLMATPTSSPGGWPTWLKPGKWYKWAMQLFINIWHYLQWLFTNMYTCHLITYSCTKSIKML